MSYTCPRCGFTSHNPHDERERYCGHCHIFEAPRKPRILSWEWLKPMDGSTSHLEVKFAHEPLIVSFRRKAFQRHWTIDIRHMGRRADTWDFTNPHRTKAACRKMRGAYGEALARRFAGVDEDA